MRVTVSFIAAICETRTHLSNRMCSSTLVPSLDTKVNVRIVPTQLLIIRGDTISLATQPSRKVYLTHPSATEDLKSCQDTTI